METPDMVQVVLVVLCFPVFVIGLAILVIAVALRLFLTKHSAKTTTRNDPGSNRSGKSNRMVVGFFHPYCNAGGGGERVLWCGIRAVQKQYEFVDCVIYTGDVDASPSEIVAKAKERFGISLHRSVEFVYLHRMKWVDAKTWPHFTLIGQSLGSMVLGLEALWKCVPDVFLDTMGFAFTFPLFRYIGGCKVGCYVHYPTISTDMLAEVKERRERFNNSETIAKSRVLSFGKMAYYRLFAWLYGVVGRTADIVLVNSSWTRDHIIKIWKAPQSTITVFPPCDTKLLLTLPVDEKKFELSFPKKIVSVGQFRPEKDHSLQVSAFAKFLKKLPIQEQIRYRLSLVGSCRNDEDMARVTSLRQQVKDCGIENLVEFHVNASYDELIKELSNSLVGIHTMHNEHFGIGIVEYMAAGVIPLAHDSGGPQMDIVIEWGGTNTGFLADSEDKYAMALKTIFSSNSHKLCSMAENARASVIGRFSEETFSKKFIESTNLLIA